MIRRTTIWCDPKPEGPSPVASHGMIHQNWRRSSGLETRLATQSTEEE